MEGSRVPAAEREGARELLLGGHYPASRPVDAEEVDGVEAKVRLDTADIGYPEGVISRLRLVELAVYAIGLCHIQPIEGDERTEILRTLGPGARLLGNDNYGFSSLQSSLKSKLDALGDHRIPAVDAVNDMEAINKISSYEAAQLKTILWAGAVVVLGGHLPALRPED